jgi:hypothetical protein
MTPKNKTRVLVAAILLIFTITQICVEMGINPIYGETPEKIGDLFMDPAGLDTESFVSLTEIWTTNAIKYRINIFDTHAVKSAQRAINDGYGDCSERAQVMHAILDSKGIPNSIIWGDISGTNLRHAAVEVYYGGKMRILGDTVGFQRKGEGLTPTERLIS